MPQPVADALSIVPPWLLLAALLGLVNGAAAFLLLGRRISRLVWYEGLGALAAGVGQVFGTAVNAPSPVPIGEVNVVAASIAVWVVVGAARLAGL